MDMINVSNGKMNNDHSINYIVNKLSFEGFKYVVTQMIIC